MMFSARSVARTMEFQREQQHWMVIQLRRSIDDFERLAADLDLAIRAEEERTHNFDPTHVAYSMLAATTRLRRDKIQRSCDELKVQLQKLHASIEDGRVYAEVA